ncbi:hypothetical protein B484DRAFT_473732, partial [Ochromonadaceae sp. CCMP2298]
MALFATGDKHPAEHPDAGLHLYSALRPLTVMKTGFGEESKFQAALTLRFDSLDHSKISVMDFQEPDKGEPATLFERDRYSTATRCKLRNALEFVETFFQAFSHPDFGGTLQPLTNSLKTDTSLAGGELKRGREGDTPTPDTKPTNAAGSAAAAKAAATAAAALLRGPKSILHCVHHVMGKLGVKDESGKTAGCGKTSGECKYRHTDVLSSLTKEQALQCTQVKLSDSALAGNFLKAVEAKTDWKAPAPEGEDGPPKKRAYNRGKGGAGTRKEGAGLATDHTTNVTQSATPTTSTASQSAPQGTHTQGRAVRWANPLAEPGPTETAHSRGGDRLRPTETAHLGGGDNDTDENADPNLQRRNGGQQSRPRTQQRSQIAPPAGHVNRSMTKAAALPVLEDDEEEEEGGALQTYDNHTRRDQ